MRSLLLLSSSLALAVAALACSVGGDARRGFSNAAAPSDAGSSNNNSSAFNNDGGASDDDEDDGGLRAPCDANLAAFGGAGDFAKAIGLCKGVLAASFTRGHASSDPPADGQHGVLPSFGRVIKPREGSRLGVLSTGWARAFNDVQATSCDPDSLAQCFKQGVQMQNGLPLLGGAPPGYPKAAEGCATSDQVFDAISLKLQIQAPKNAKGFSIDFDFYSGEWPDYVCTQFNDAFLIVLTSKALNNGTPSNIAFDAKQAPISVNNAFFDRCTVGTQTGCRGQPPYGPIFKTSTCGGDLSELEDTGFYVPGLYCNGQLSTGGGATGWLTTKSPVVPAEIISLEFIIWDTGDPKFDSSVLLDHFTWILDDSASEAPSTTRLR